MSTPEPVTVPMIICPTSHNDWDWEQTFEGYYAPPPPGHGVRGILQSVVTLLAGTALPETEFRFSYAEVGYLRRYLADFPDRAAVLQAAGHRFCLLGGGITSPDNQACHGEVFIRNYLTGHDYLRSVGLIDNVFFVAWLPDDFGHDPQLPALIEALGMDAIALSRIPGSPQPTLCPPRQPADAAVRANGLSFHWPGNDGSKVLTHFMPSTYYGITAGLNPDEMTSKSVIQGGIQTFLDDNYYGVVWPGGTIFATEGGDWQFPTSSAEGGTASGAYDWIDVNGASITSSAGYVTAACRLGTFADYHDALMQSAGDIPTAVLYAENFYTGYFASRPQLKIDQYQAAQLLVGTEVLGSVLAVHHGTSAGDQAALAEKIAGAWNLLVPTTHHDFVTGTSPDDVYQVSAPKSPPVWDSSGQLPMSGQAVALATDAMGLAMTQLAGAVAATPGANEIAVVVFNQVGCDLPDTAIVEMADPSGGTTDFMVRVGDRLGFVQRSSEGTLLFQVPGMRSMSYRVVYLVPEGRLRPPTPPTDATGVVTLSNDGLVTLTLSEEDGWAITQLMIGNDRHVQQDGTYANRIGIWTDDGNIYQFGMEYTTGCNQGTFAFASFPNGQGGRFVEFGPIRWRFTGTLENGFTTQYDLVRGETLVRITTTGAACSGTSVLTSFSMQTPVGQVGTVLEYGTSCCWENRDPQQSWDGLTFRASRDFAQVAASLGIAVAAVYHNGIPAWTIDGSILRGCLLRNTPGVQRAAYGSDSGTHTQSYTLDVQGQLAVTGHPLRTALYAQTPLRAVEVALAPGGTMPESGQLASVAQPDAVLRVGKMNPASDDGIRSLILRVQQACMGAQRLDVDLPFLVGGGLSGRPAIVTALETTPRNAPAVELSGTTASFEANRALWTMRVPITPPSTR
jgi:alpha-mannosidase